MVVVVLAGRQAQAVGDPGGLLLLQRPRLVVSALLGLQRHIFLQETRHIQENNLLFFIQTY